VDNWLTAGEGLVAASISVVGVLFTASANRRAQYDRVLTLVAESGSQPLADDRHVIGLRFEPQPKLTSSKVLVLSNDEIAALFRVLWYFERADALFKSWRPVVCSKRITRAQALLLDSIGPTANIWAKYIRQPMVNADAGPVGTDGSDEGLTDLSDQYLDFRPSCRPDA
jgi:hypothetical protein